jgi:plastocyanin
MTRARDRRSEHQSRLGRRVLTRAFCAVGVAVVAGCSTPAASNSAPGSTASGEPTASTSAAANSATTAPSSSRQMIMIEKFAYRSPASVSPGATVSVMNMDGEGHTVTADTGGDFDVQAPAGKTVTFTAPTVPGTYAFHCTYHSNMHGVLIVG